MKQSITHRPLLVAIILLISVFTVSAQDFVVVGSSRVIKVDRTIGHVYKWEVKKDGKFLNFKKEVDTYTVSPAGAPGTVAFIGGLNPTDILLNDFFQVEIKWPSLGDYKIFMTCSNENGCETKSTFDISVVDSPILANLSGEIYDLVTSEGVGNARAISIPVKFTSVPDRTVLPLSDVDKAYNIWKKAYCDKHITEKYTINLKYKYYTEQDISAEQDFQNKINNTEDCIYDCNVDYLKAFGKAYDEQLTDKTDRYFEFHIASIQDAYGANVAFTANTFVFGIYKKPAITRIQFKN